MHTGMQTGHIPGCAFCLTFTQSSFLNAFDLYAKCSGAPHVIHAQVEQGELREVRELVAALNPGARIIQATRGSVATADILCTGAFDFDKVLCWCASARTYTQQWPLCASKSNHTL